MPEVIFAAPQGSASRDATKPSKKQGRADRGSVLNPPPAVRRDDENQIRLYNLLLRFACSGGFSVPCASTSAASVALAGAPFDPRVGPSSRTHAAPSTGRSRSIRTPRPAGSRGGLLSAPVIGMQSADARPEIEGFISIGAHGQPLRTSPFPRSVPLLSGLFVHGSEDRVAPVKEVNGGHRKVKTQKGIQIEHAVVEGANHFFDGKVDEADGPGPRLSRQARRIEVRRSPPMQRPRRRLRAWIAEGRRRRVRGRAGPIRGADGHGRARGREAAGLAAGARPVRGRTSGVGPSSAAL